MKVVFFGKGSRTLGEIDFLSGIASVTAVGVTLQLLRDPQIGCRYIPILPGCPQAPSGPVLILYILVAIGSLIIFFVSWKRIITAIFFALRESIRRVNIYNVITQEKMRDEIRSFPNASINDFKKQIGQAKKDEKTIEDAKDLGIIKGKYLWKHKWPKIQGRLKTHAEINVSSSNKKDSYEKAIAELQRIIDDENNIERVKVYVSSVQPAVLYCIKSVLEDCNNTDLINVEDSMPTGPATVEKAYNREIDKPSADETVLFSAPLSAFITFSEGQTGHEINEMFVPISCLVLEKQDILISNGRETNPIRKGTIFVYDNSTAEECLTRIPKGLVAPTGAFKVNLVEDFEDYKNLLHGKTNAKGDKIQKGDGIMVWPPLTSYFLNKEINGCHFAHMSNPNLTEDRNSRIMMYAPSSVTASSEDHKLAWAFIDALSYKFLLEKDNRWSSLTLIFSESKVRRFLSDYQVKFKDIVE